MTEVKIRPTIAPDLNILVALDHSCQSDYVWQMDVSREDTQTTIFFREIRLPRSIVVSYPKNVSNLVDTWNRRSGMLTAMVDEAIIGYIRMNDSFQPLTALLTDVVVSPRFRRQGVATTLILAAQAWAESRHNNRILLEMTSKNIPAIRLAQKLGFEFSGYNDNYYESKDIALFFGRTVD